MNWYKGSVIEAITEAKKENGIFIVYIYDKNELSKSTREKLYEEELSQIFSSLKYIAIEIENGSKDAIQFAQIYPLIVVPSLFFISPQTGIPLEVIAGNFDSKALADKIKNLNLSNEAKAPIVSSKKEDIETNSEIDQKAADKKEECSDTSPIAVASSVAVAVAESSTCNNLESSHDLTTSEYAITSSPSEDNVEEKVRRAKDLISQRQEVKAAEEVEDEKRKEIERRRQSQEVAKAKQKRDELERMELGRQRKKDKEEDKLARERVKAQIAADRAERQTRISLLKGEQPPPVEQEAARPDVNPPVQNPNRNDITRIKFRFPDNSSELAQFPSSATLNDVHSHLVENSKFNSSKFKLIGTLPSRTFTDTEMALTLVDLGLVPSAILIVKPITSDSSVSFAPVRKSVILFLWSMFSPLIFLYHYFRGYLGLEQGEPVNKDGSSDEEEEAQASKRPRTEGSYTTRNRPKTAYGNRPDGGAFLRREGNIHRLNRRGDDDDDDENNTWNGNSTQQM